MIRSNKGETLTETLVALLIGVLAMTMLPMAIVTSAKINNSIVHEPALSTVEDRSSSGRTESTGLSVKIKVGSEAPVQVSNVKVYKYDVFTAGNTGTGAAEDAGYLFFEYVDTTGTDGSSD